MAHRLILAFAFIASAWPAMARDVLETWTATSTTASSITGDVRFSGDKITFQNGNSLPLQKLESIMVEDFDGKAVPAMLYRVTKPANPVLLMENTLCGRNAVTYIAVRPFAGGGRSLDIYYGPKLPSGVNSSGHCGTFNYEARQ